MQNLTDYLRVKNFRRNMFGEANLEFPRDLKIIVRSLGVDLSPENLTCDGELSRTEINKRSKFLNAVVQDIRNAGHRVEIEL